MPSNHELFERSKAVIPGGVNSSIRAFRSVGGEPYVVESAAGATVTDYPTTDLTKSTGELGLEGVQVEAEAVLGAAG